MDFKALFAGIAIVFSFLAFLPYIISIKQGKTRPHVFSWVIWGITTFIVFLAQLVDHGGAGAWPTGISGIITIYVAILAYRKRADISITNLDYWFLGAALASLPFWYLTNNPLWTVIILTTIDSLGFGPTFRKAYHYPF
ncbi:MAG: hypothetical protein R3240_11075, partial [Gammaproteobacteria bacterium]|nr:hypothetical protein [Gammaproteobacteria bacterium]